MLFILLVLSMSLFNLIEEISSKRQFTSNKDCSNEKLEGSCIYYLARVSANISNFLINAEFGPVFKLLYICKIWGLLVLPLVLALLEDDYYYALLLLLLLLEKSNYPLR